jgi:restriction system protein
MTYWRINLGEKGKFAQEALEEGWIGTGWASEIDLITHTSETKDEFKAWFIPALADLGLENRRAASNATTATFALMHALKDGDIVFTRKAEGDFQVGQVIGPYYFEVGHELAHRRPVQWFEHSVGRDQLSPLVKATFSALGTVVEIRGYEPDIQALYDAELAALAADRIPSSSQTTNVVEANASFVLEKYLEEFLVSNWNKTPLGATYNLIESQVDTQLVGRIDILAETKDKKSLVVIELKLGRTSDTVVGQVQRYMGWVQEHYAEQGQTVEGIIIGAEDDARIRYALKVAPNIDLMKYTLDFKLESL